MKKTLFRKKNNDSATASAVAEQVADKEEKPTRQVPKAVNIGIIVVLTLLGLYHIYVGFFGARSAMELRAIHWLVISTVIFLLYPARKKGASKITWLDIVFSVLAFAAGLYILLNWQRIAENASIATTTDIVFGAIAILIVLEAARRAIGPVLAGLAGIFLLYAFFGHLIPGMLGHREYTFYRVVKFLYTGTEGIFGTAMDVSAKYVALFVLFGALLEYFGGGQLFVDLAYSLTGKHRGGPAKASVVSSALMGTMSGSAVANVVTTGAFTIPLMKKNGYRPYFAGSVEAVSSTGGQILPPVMGAAAFLMAEMTGISYNKISLAALIPAFFYFFSIFIAVDLVAKKENIGVLEDSEIIPLRKVLRGRGYLILPVILLIALIVSGYSAIKSAAYAMALILILDVIFSKDRKHMPKKFLEAVAKGMRSMISVAAACACAGIIVGVISLTGIGTKFSSFMISIANGNMFLALLMTMVAALVLGCGLPTTAAYIVLSSLAVPALIKLGVPLLSAHLFVFYYGSISTITPPVALSSYAAAALAGANPNKVGFQALKLGIVAFIIPFMFVYQPALLMQGAVFDVILAVVTGTIGVVLLSVGMQGWWKAKCGVLEILLAVAGGLMMMYPGWITDLTGIACGVVLVVIQLAKAKKARVPAVTAESGEKEE